MDVRYVPDYAPLNGNIGASAGIALIPIILLFGLLFVTKVIYAGEYNPRSTLSAVGQTASSRSLYGSHEYEHDHQHQEAQ